MEAGSERRGIAGFGDGAGGLEPRTFVLDGKGKEMDSPLQPSEGTVALLTPWF